MMCAFYGQLPNAFDGIPMDVLAFELACMDSMIADGLIPLPAGDFRSFMLAVFGDS